jgi:hypothetical protein
MPLRDHFHKPLLNNPSPESLTAVWGTLLMLQLNRSVLPAGYRAEQEVFGGPRVTIDLAALERGRKNGAHSGNGANGGVATATQTYAPPATLAAEVTFAEPDLFEVRVLREGDRIAAAIELVSRSNKDRPDTRRAFAIKCASYLQAGVSVVFVDVVTERRADLHTELANLLDLPDPLRWASPSGIAAVSYRVVGVKDVIRMEAWPVALQVGSPLPTLPLWLHYDLAVPLDLESTYEAAFGGHRTW